VTLPSAAELYGKEITFKKISQDSNDITIAAPIVGGLQQLVDVDADQTITDPMQSLVIAGNQWA